MFDRCHMSQSPSYQTSGYPFISVVMYAVHTLIVLPRSPFSSVEVNGRGMLRDGGLSNSLHWYSGTAPESRIAIAALDVFITVT